MALDAQLHPWMVQDYTPDELALLRATADARMRDMEAG